MTDRALRHITGLADGSLIRSATFEDRPHIVVPVVALLGDAVIRPLGSEGPEFVPADELAAAPAGWNNRPVLPDHPNGGRSSANEPRTLESFAFGALFHTRFEDGKLKTEAWLDPAKAEKVGPQALDVLAALENGDMVEVSVGCFITAIAEEGVSPSGKPYTYRWSDIVPDHLAIGLNGSEGACSVEMGCGAPRASKANKEGSMNNGLIQRALAAVGRLLKDDKGQSDNEFFRGMWDALRAAEPGFDSIIDIFRDSGTVVYVAMPGREWVMMRRSFTVDAAGGIVLSNTKERVEPVTKYEAVKMAQAEPQPRAASADPDPAEPDVAAVDTLTSTNPDQPVAASEPAASAPCGCGNTTGAEAAPTNKEDHRMTDSIKELVGRLIANTRSPFKEDQCTHLASLGEETLRRLEEQYVEPDSAPAPVPDPDLVTLKREEADDMRAAANAFKAMQAKHKAALVARLAKAQTEYVEDELRAMTVDQLDRTVRLLGLNAPAEVDYVAARAVPDLSDQSEAVAPDPWKLKKEAS